MVSDNFKKFLSAVFDELDSYELLRRIYYKKMGQYPKRKSSEILKEELINEVDWDENTDKQWLIDILAEHRIKSRPWSALIIKIDENTDFDSFLESLNNNKCEFVGTTLIKDGFYNISTNGNTIRGEYWYKFTRSIITENYEVKEIEYPTPIRFKVDFDKKLIYVNESEPKKLQKIKSIFFKRLGLKLEDAGLKQLSPEEANDKMKGFLEELKNILEGGG